MVKNSFCTFILFFLTGFPIAGSLSFGGRTTAFARKRISGSTVCQTPTAYETNQSLELNQQQQKQKHFQQLTPQQQQRPKLSEFSAKLASFPSISASIKPGVSLVSSSQSTNQRIQQQQLRTGNSTMSSIPLSLQSKIATSVAGVLPVQVMEPKAPASITNIGGEIMRSKTADFEKISSAHLVASRSVKTQNTTRITATAKSNTKSNDGSIVTSGSPTDANVARRQSQTQLYKRQELISSAKRHSKY